MKKLFDLATWKRREHFEYFKDFDEPLFGMTVRVECSAAYRKAKNLGSSFSLYYLYLSLKVANEMEEFRYRIEEDQIFCYDSIGAGLTILREDETYGCGFMEYSPDLQTFMLQASSEVKRVQAERGLKYPHSGEDTIHYSILPLAAFTSVNHARRLDSGRSIPKITFGKFSRDNNDQMWLPVDIHVNHALMDGFHVGKYIERFQELLAPKFPKGGFG